MKKIIYSLFTGFCLLGLFACSDVPSPYDVYNPGGNTSDSIKTLPYSETFTSGLGDFTIQNVTLPDGLSFVWTYSSNYGCMKGSAYNSTNFAAESWLISPQIDLTSDTAAILTFDHSTGYLYSNDPNDFMKLMVSTDYVSGDPQSGNWTALAIPNWYSGTAFDFVASGSISLNAYLGQKNVHIAFKYMSTSSTAPTWEVKNVSITQTGGGGTIIDTSAKTLPYTEDFSANQGAFTIDNVTLPTELSYIWTFANGYSCMKASAYKTANYAAQSWLISPAITLKGQTAAILNFNHAYRYMTSGNTSDYMKVMVSKDYVSGDPSTATWSELTVPGWNDGTAFTFTASGNISLASYVGESNVHIAFKYTSTASVAPTWEIKNFSVTTTGTDGGGGGGDVTGEGSKTQPYTVAQAQSNQGKTAWVKGYIVGYVNGQTYSTGATFAVPTAAETEILIADAADCTTATLCLPVQLPAGAVRTGLELFAHPTYLGKSVELYGSLEKYFGVSGMKSTSCAIIDGTTIGTDPTGTGGGGTDVTDALYSETFSGGQGSWVTTSVSGTKNWEFTSYSGTYYAKISAYGTTAAQEAWLISPEINLTKDCTFTFSVAVGYYNAGCLNVLVADDYTGSVADASWESLNFALPTTPTTGYGTFAAMTAVSLKSYTGSKVRIAFQYTGDGSASKTTTYEITGITVK